MNLRRLKKQLKQDLKNQEAKNKTYHLRRWLLILLLVVVSAGGFYPLYRQYEKSAPQRLMNKAIEQESLGRTNEALLLYRKLKTGYPGSEEAPSAIFRTAKIQQYDIKDERGALLSYLQLEKDYPDTHLLLTAREESARIIKFTLRDYSRAIEFYQHLLSGGQGSLDLYLYEIADCYFRLENYTQARIELDMLIETYPQSPLLADALYRKGGLLVLENRLEQARENWQELIDRFPRSSYRPQAEFNLAKMLEEQELLSEALEKYRQLVDFPRPALLEAKIKSLEKRIEAKKKAI